MKLSLTLLLMTIIASCSGGGGGNGGGGETEQSPRIVYIYPENTLGPGQGVVEVSPIGAKCFLPNGDEATVDKCPALAEVDLATAPRESQRSPSGDALVVITNSDEESITISFGEGESWTSYENSVKVEKSSGKINCQGGFSFSYQATCEVPSPTFLYGEWSSNIPEICGGQDIQTRTYTCISNITGGVVDPLECSALTPDISRVVLSPSGIKNNVTLPNGDVVSLSCEEGADETGLGTTAIVMSASSCGPEREIKENGLCDYSLVCTGDTYRIENTCIPDVFTVVELLYESPPVGAGMNISVAPTGVKICTRDRQGVVEEVDPSKCTVPAGSPSILMNSPAGTYYHTTAQGDLYTYELTAGQVFDEYLPKSGVVSCGPNREEIPLEKFCANRTGITDILPVSRGFLILWDDETSKIVSDGLVPASLNTLITAKEITGVHTSPISIPLPNNDIYTVKSGGLYLNGSNAVTQGYHSDAVDLIVGNDFVIKVKEDGSGEFTHNTASFDDITIGLDFRDVKQVDCFSYSYGWANSKACLILKNDGTLTTTNPDLLNNYEVDPNEDTPPVINVVSMASEFTTGIKKFRVINQDYGHNLVILKEDGSLHFIGVKSTLEGKTYLANLPPISGVTDFQSGNSIIVEKTGDVIERYAYENAIGGAVLYDGAIAINRDHPNHLFNEGIYLVDGTVRSFACSSVNESLGEVLWFSALPQYMCGNQMGFINSNDNSFYQLQSGAVTSTGWRMNTIISKGDYLASRISASWRFYYQGGQRSGWNTNKP